MSTTTITIEFDDNALLSTLYGEHNAHLLRLEENLNVKIRAKGNEVTLIGDAQNVAFAQTVLESLWARVKKNLPVGFGEINAAVRVAQSDEPLNQKTEKITKMHDEKSIIKTSKRTVTPRSSNQALYIEAMKDNNLVFGLGPAGTGKTYLAVARAVNLFQGGDVKKIILSRPAVEAGERLGFLPGDMKEKVDPYFRPIYDALHDLLGREETEKRIESGDIEIAPLAFMRGRTLSNAFIILDEAQNTTSMQMKMFLTRLGPNSFMVINGDHSQIDLPKGVTSGLKEAMHVLKDEKEIAIHHFTDKDVVRHKLVSRIIVAYDKANKDRLNNVSDK